jgi:hypothetical protein
MSIIKQARDLQVGDQCVERDGALLTVTATERLGRDVVVVWGWLGSACPCPTRFRGTRRLHVFAPAVEFGDETIVRILDTDTDEEEWRGPWAEFRAANADDDEVVEVESMLRSGLAGYMGGGAQPCVRIEVVS